MSTVPVVFVQTTLMLTSSRKPSFISIGFSGPKVTLNRLPGWEPESWAYHGDDGLTFSCSASGKNYGPKYSTGDVIGCGVNFRTGQAFFTKNGVNLGMSFEHGRLSTQGESRICGLPNHGNGSKLELLGNNVLAILFTSSQNFAAPRA